MMGKVKLNIDFAIQRLSAIIYSEGAVIDAIPHLSRDVSEYLSGSYLNKPLYRKLCKESLDKHNIKRISLEETIKKNFKNTDNQKISIEGSIHLKTFTPVYYKNEKRLSSFINDSFREDRVVRYFKLNNQNGNKESSN